MRSDKALLLLTFFLITSSNILSQDIIKSIDYPQDFRAPLDIRPTLAGFFGEIRGNHFHSGLDYRTNQREGYPVYAVADGFISRLRVQIGGFGNAIYISHPNGYTSVYAHLQRFNTRVAQTVKDLQYRKESFVVDFPLLPIEIPVKKGDVIAWSGNTGSSGGPHLHFEMRDTKTEETINPQLFGFEVADNVKPTISALYMYRINNKPFSELTPSQYFQVNGSNGDYYLNQSPIINFNGQIGFGIVGFDQQLSGGNKNGIYSIELILDDKPIYTSVLERFAFEDSRAINSHIDYPALISYKRIVQKSFVEPGNPLNIYKNVINSGLIELGDDEIHRVKYVVKDTKGNISTLNFRIKKNSQAVIPQQKDAGIKLFVYADSSNYLTDRMRVAIPKGSLYDNINFNYSISNRPDKAYSVIHNIHTRNIPVHKPYYLWIKPDVSIPEYLREKALITDSRGASHGGEFDRGFIRANPKSFGSFYVQLDTVAPLIRPVNISDGKSMSDISKIVLKMTDNLSGISSFSATIDGHWVLFEYDAKTSTVWHTFDEGMNPGKHFLQFTATDMKKNIRTYNATFIK